MTTVTTATIGAPTSAHPRLYDLCAGAWNELTAQQSNLSGSVSDAAAWIGRAADVLATNLATGRFGMADSFPPAGAADDAALRSYARQVINGLLTEDERLSRLRGGETDAWRPVIERLERLAFFWHGPFGREDWAAWEAREVTAATCADLWLWLQSHAFPFDVPFDRWSARALTNRLQERARQRRRAPDVESLNCDDLLCDPPGENGLDTLILREALQEALAELPARQAAVIRLWYLEGWRPDEIATHLKTRVSNVYVLRYRGLQALRKNRLHTFIPRKVERAVKLM